MKAGPSTRHAQAGPSTRNPRGRRGLRRRSALGAPRIAVAAAALALAGCMGAAGSAEHEPLVVAAAADLRPAFAELGASFEADTGAPVTFTFGSSGQLAQQVIEGAPVDLYASASATFVDAVLAAGRGDPGTRATYAVGRLALWARTDTWGGWGSLDDLVADPAARTIAIANPTHAPYGRAAQEALESAGHRDAVADRLVYGENIADAHRLAASGNADAALTALSLALAAGDDGTWTLVPEELHERVEQVLVVVAEDPARAELAARFVAHVNRPEGREVMRRYGFLLPGEAPPEAWEG